MDEKISILMVDDQPGKLLTYEAMLAELGENLIKAHSGMEALEHLLKTDVAVLLMDVSMPGMDGFETAQMIHDHPRFQNTLIVFISGIHMTDLDRLRGYQHAAVDYLSVPVVPELLRAKVRVARSCISRHGNWKCLSPASLRCGTKSGDTSHVSCTTALGSYLPLSV